MRLAALFRRRARVALASDNDAVSVETLAEIQRRTLNGIVLVIEKALAKGPPSSRP
jgi:hypothetical protein